MTYASALDLRGLVDLDRKQPAEALTSSYAALVTREKILGSNDPFIAFSLDDLAIQYTELPDFSIAKSLHEKAVAVRLQHKRDLIGTSYSNFSALLLGSMSLIKRRFERCDYLYDEASLLHIQNHSASAMRVGLLLDLIRCFDEFPNVCD